MKSLRNWLASSLVCIGLMACGPDGPSFEVFLDKQCGRGKFSAPCPTPPPITTVLNIVSWDPNQEADLAKYRVYRGFTNTAMEVAGEVTVATFSEQVSASGIEVFYEITAIDTSGNESPHSLRVSKQL